MESLFQIGADVENIRSTLHSEGKENLTGRIVQNVRELHLWLWLFLRIAN